MHLVGTLGPTSSVCQIYQWGNRAYRHGGREYRTIGAVNESEERRIFLVAVAVGVIVVVVRKAEERQIWEVAVAVGNQDLSRPLPPLPTLHKYSAVFSRFR